MSRAPKLLASEKTVAELLDLKRSELRSLVECGALPSPKDFHGFARWNVAEIEAICTGEAMDNEEFEV